MTRFLSDSLQAHEPYFQLGLRQLEASKGNPGADIRLTAALKQELRAKLHQLGLDPHDTTPDELYHALEQRFQDDNQRLTRSLQTRAATYISAEADVTAGMVHALQELQNQRCYALKATTFRAIMKKLPPKKVMKQLGYRSLASFLKHESPAAILAVASVCEDDRWHQNLLASYKKLKPRDFETRQVQFIQAECSKWMTLAHDAVSMRKHTVLCFKELGAMVFLPLTKDAPAGAVTASLGIAALQLNELLAASSYLKLAQVRPDFGEAVQKIAVAEAELNSRLLDRPVPWHLIQRYYSRLKEHFNDAVFEPYIQLEDMSWQAAEKILSAIEPSLSFWHDTSHLGMLHAHKPVSFNIIDVALNYCNQVPFESRLTQYFQHSLWHELLLGYLHRDTIEGTILHELQPQLTAEYAAA